MMRQSLLPTIKLSTVTIRLIYGGSHLFRRFSTAQKLPADSREYSKHDLYHRLSFVWSTGEKVSDVLDQFSRNGGKNVKIPVFLHCIKKFRNYGRYQHCLEILEWMEKGTINFKDDSLRLNLISKVKGINEAEKYFNSIPSDLKEKPVYGALLNCYCSEKMTDKALALFEKMDEMNYCTNLEFTNLLCLYIKVDQPEKVPPLVEEMKRRNIPLHSVSYQTWMQSYALLNDLEGVQRVMDEVQQQKSFKEDWKIYSSYVSACIKSGEYQKADPYLKQMEEIMDNSMYIDRVAYNFLISLYSRAGDSESVTRAWIKLKSRFKGCNNLSYLTMLHALSKLGNLEDLRLCFEEWNSRYKSYDARLPNCVISCYLKHDMLDEAKQVLKDATDRSGQKIWGIHVTFMDYYLGKCQVDSALKHLKMALANQWPWQLNAEKLDKFFEFFIEKKDVDGAEQLCQMLEKDHPLTSTVYLGLLETYAAAGKTAPEMHRRMVESGVNIGTEHEELLETVCPGANQI